MKFELHYMTPNELRVQLQHFLFTHDAPQDVGTFGKLKTIEVPGSMPILKFAEFIADKFKVRHFTDTKRVCLIPVSSIYRRTKK